MMSLLAGTVAHEAPGGRGVSTSHVYFRGSPELPGILRNSPVTALTTLFILRPGVYNVHLLIMLKASARQYIEKERQKETNARCLLKN